MLRSMRINLFLLRLLIVILLKLDKVILLKIFSYDVMLCYKREKELIFDITCDCIAIKLCNGKKFFGITCMEYLNFNFVKFDKLCTNPFFNAKQNAKQQSIVL